MKQRMVGLILVLAAGAARGQPGLRVEVYMNERDASSLLLGPGKQLASSIFQKIGVRLNWREGELPAGKAGVVVCTARHPPESASGEALAATRLSDGVRVEIAVYEDRLRQFLDAHRSLREAAAGYVLAHELAHGMQGVARHSESGIMKAHWEKQDFQEMILHKLAFTVEDINSIHEGLAGQRPGHSAPDVRDASMGNLHFSSEDAQSLQPSTDPSLPGGSLPASCTKIPLVNAAWKQLPPGQRFPCDSKHLIIVSNYAAFLKTHPEISENEALREKGRHAFAFSTGNWPVYINLDSHQALFERFTMGEYWVAYPVAGVLAHERIHAVGDLSESAALLEELRLDRRFRDEGKLPKTFDLDGLQRQYLEALAEDRRPAAPPIRLMSAGKVNTSPAIR